MALVGDWDGDGVDTVGVYNPVTSTFFLKNSNSPGPGDLVFGYGPAGAGWMPMAGDWNGDGKDTIAFYDPIASTFFLKNTNTGGAADLMFTFQVGVPVCGRWQ